MKAVRVMIAHTDERMAEKLQSVIEGDPRVAVVANATTGDDCVKKVGITWPTVVVMETTFPDMTAAACIKKLSQTRVPLAVLICSTKAVKGDKDLEAALTAGAYNFILLPEDPGGIDTIGRQILTTIHVTGFSKTKNIPQVDSNVELHTAATSAVAHAKLNCVVMDVAPQHMQSVGWIMCRVHPQGEPTVIVVVRQPTGGADQVLAEFGPKLHTRAEPYADGMVLAPGRIVVLDDGSNGKMDLVAGIDDRERVTLKRVRSEGLRRIPGVDPVRLCSTLADHYTQTFAVIMFGKPTLDSPEALIAAKERGGFTMAYEHSTDLLTDITRRFPDQQIPDDLVTLEQIDRFMNAVLISR